MKSFLFVLVLFAAFIPAFRGDGLDVDALLLKYESDPHQNRRVADELMRREKYKLAAHYYERVVADTPDSSSGHRQLAWALFYLDRLSRAEARFFMAVRLDPSDVDARRGLARCLSERAKKSAFAEPGVTDARRKESRYQLEEVVRLDPDDASSLVLLAQLQETHRAEDAIRILKRAIDRQPESAEAHHVLALHHYRRGDVDLAIVHFQSAVAFAGRRRAGDLPDNRRRSAYLEYQMSLGLAYEDASQLERAVSVYAEALGTSREIARGNRDDEQRAKRLSETLRLRMCRALLRKPDPKGALACYARAEASRQQHGGVHRAHVDDDVALNNRGVCYYLIGDADEAVAHLESAALRLPNSTVVRTNLAIATVASGKAREGFRHVREATRLLRSVESAPRRRRRRQRHEMISKRTFQDLDPEEDIFTSLNRATEIAIDVGLHYEMIRTLLDLGSDVTAAMRLWRATTRSETSHVDALPSAVTDSDARLSNRMQSLARTIERALGTFSTRARRANDTDAILRAPATLQSKRLSSGGAEAERPSLGVVDTATAMHILLGVHSHRKIVGALDDVANDDATALPWNRNSTRERSYQTHLSLDANISRSYYDLADLFADNDHEREEEEESEYEIDGPCSGIDAREESHIRSLAKLGELLLLLRRPQASVQCFVRVFVATLVNSDELRAFQEDPTHSAYCDILPSARAFETDIERGTKGVSIAGGALGSLARLRLANMLARRDDADASTESRLVRTLLASSVHLLLPQTTSIRQVRPPHTLETFLRAADAHENATATSETSLAYRRQAVVSFPSSVRANYVLGRSLLIRGLFGEAVLRLRETLLLRPSHGRAHKDLAVALRRTHRSAEALQHLDAALRFDRASMLPNEIASIETERGMMWEDLGELQRSADAYLRAIEIDSASPASYLRLGAMLVREGQLVSASKIYMRMLRQLPSNLDALLALGQIYERRRLFAAAARTYAAVLDRAPWHTVAARRGASALRDIGHFGAAELVVQRTVGELDRDLSGSNPVRTREREQLLEIGREVRRGRLASEEAFTLLEEARELLVSDGKLSAALERARMALDVVPAARRAVALTEIGALQELGGLDDDAAQSYRRALKETPADARSQLRLSAMLFGQNRVVGATKLCKALIEKSDRWMDDTDIVDVIRDARLLLARLHRSTGHLGLSHEQYKRLLSEDASADRALSPETKAKVLAEFAEVAKAMEGAAELGPAMLAMKRPTEAALAFEAALAANPDDDRSRLGLARAWVASGAHRWDAALDLFRSVDLERFDPDSLHDFGILLRRAGAHSDALLCFRAASRAAPQNVDMLHLLGSQLFHMGDATASVSVLRKARAIAPSKAGILNDLGAAHFALGQLEDARVTFQQSLELAPTFETHVNLALVLRDQSRTAEAVDHLKRAVRLSETSSVERTSAEVVRDGVVVAREVEVAVRIPERDALHAERLNVLRVLADLCRGRGDLSCAIDASKKMCDLLLGAPETDDGRADLVETVWLLS